jgi:hypothetical protein
MAIKESTLYKWYEPLPPYIKGIVIVGGLTIVTIAAFKIYNGIASGISAAKASADQAARDAQVDNQITSLQNPSNPNSTPQQATFSDAEYSNFADAITTAFTGCNAGNLLSAAAVGILTDAGTTLFNIVKQFKNDIDLLKLQKAFGTKTISKSGWTCMFVSDYNNVDLVSAVNKQLDVQEIAYINDYLQSNGFTYRF